ncbi:unnamed protein product [Rangifer tarandus platyrhynchus]|uniref:Uncharacterized protein n=1 Tax=Rangifer tarandus platyrhynchus TaxID=3082113 RepID=A0ABN8XS43_RANTA|nr:unnamed protein product [Rangifer tarandus platyrhynchus]
MRDPRRTGRGVTCQSARRLPRGRFLSRLPPRPGGRGRPGRYRAGEGPGRFRICRESLCLGPAPLLPAGCPRSRRLGGSRRPTHFVSPVQLTTRRTPKSLKSDALESL